MSLFEKLNMSDADANAQLFVSDEKCKKISKVDIECNNMRKLIKEFKDFLESTDKDYMSAKEDPNFSEKLAEIKKSRDIIRCKGKNIVPIECMYKLKNESRVEVEVEVEGLIINMRMCKRDVIFGEKNDEMIIAPHVFYFPVVDIKVNEQIHKDIDISDLHIKNKENEKCDINVMNGGTNKTHKMKGGDPDVDISDKFIGICE